MSADGTVCACCVDNECECEGSRLTSARDRAPAAAGLRATVTLRGTTMGDLEDALSRALEMIHLGIRRGEATEGEYSYDIEGQEGPEHGN